MDRLFVETSVQVRRLTTRKGRLSFNQACQKVGMKQCVTSLFVLMELRRTLCEDILFVRDRLLEIEPNLNGKIRLTDITESIGSSTGIFGKRQCQRLFLVVARLEVFFAGEEFISARAIADFLEVLSKEYLRMAVILPVKDTIVDIDLINLVRCSAISAEDVPFLPPHRISCRMEEAQCDIDTLVNGEKETLTKFISIEPNDSLDPKTVEILALFLKGESSTLRGQKRCWRVGDVVIALEAKGGGCSHVLSLDKQFRPLCMALGIEGIVGLNV